MSSTFPAGGSKPSRFQRGGAGAGLARAVAASLVVAADAFWPKFRVPTAPPEAAAVAAALRRPGPGARALRPRFKLMAAAPLRLASPPSPHQFHGGGGAEGAAGANDSASRSDCD